MASHAVAPVRPESGRWRLRIPAAARLLRLELRRSTMLILLPLLAVLLGATELRNDLGHPPLWAVRSMDLQIQVELTGAIVAAVAAWVATRDRRRHVTDLVLTTVRSRWSRQLTAWAAVTGWALVFYGACVAVVYGVTATQTEWGGPIWWLPAVGAAAIVAFSAVGFAVGSALPSRFTAPLVAIVALFAPQIGVIAIQHGHPWGRVSFAEGATVPGTATIFRFHAGLSIAQLLFLVGVAGVAVGALALPRGAGGRRLRAVGAVATTLALLAAGTGVALADTARETTEGVIIPALHSAADDRPLVAAPVCDHSVVPICVHPAYQAMLPVIAAQIAPLLAQVAGVPGAPVRVEIGSTSPTADATHVLVIGPAILANPGLRFDTVPPDLRTDVAINAIQAVVAEGRGPIGPAQQAIAGALAQTTSLALTDRQPDSLLPTPGSPAAAAARRFAALAATTRHDWLVSHVEALRAGRLTLTDIP
jgi:hypothetical protein